jgi:hypothetical protein
MSPLRVMGVKSGTRKREPDDFHHHHLLNTVLTRRLCGTCWRRVGKQIVNVPSFMVRVDSQKHIDFALNSPFGGGRPGRNKRKALKCVRRLHWGRNCFTYPAPLVYPVPFDLVFADVGFGRLCTACVWQ